MHSFTYSIIIFVAFIIKVNTTANNNVESWTGKWFPENPQEVKKANNDLDELFGGNKLETSNNTLTKDKNNSETWNGKLFPKNTIGKENVGGNNKNISKTWNGNWFPQKPSYEFINKNMTGYNSHERTVKAKNNETWKGNWFPQNPSNKAINNNSHESTTEFANKPWNGIWFPASPSSEVLDLTKTINSNSRESTTEGFTGKSWDGIWFPASPSSEVLDVNLMSPLSQCDNGKDEIDIDFDPENKRHAYKYLCLNFKASYEPSYSIYPLQRKNIIPPAYESPSYCLNETIIYEERLPTFGAHRYLPPKYGEYKYLPIQRWMHSLEKGAIVMLYHPCANQMQVEKLRNIVTACLYRHVISPSTLLLPERPLALVAWGTSLEISVVHMPVVVEFIKSNAKHGLQTKYDDENSYQAGILTEAKLVTDESDSELCPNFNL